MTTLLSYGQAKEFIDHMSEPQLARVMNRMRHYSAAFPDIHDAVAQSVADELAAIATNRQPDDPGISQYQEPDVGHYPGWLTAICWLGPTAAFWAVIALLITWLFR
jgi:hypothetical protein